MAYEEYVNYVCGESQPSHELESLVVEQLSSREGDQKTEAGMELGKCLQERKNILGLVKGVA